MGLVHCTMNGAVHYSIKMPGELFQLFCQLFFRCQNHHQNQCDTTLLLNPIRIFSLTRLKIHMGNMIWTFGHVEMAVSRKQQNFRISPMKIVWLL